MFPQNLGPNGRKTTPEQLEFLVRYYCSVSSYREILGAGGLLDHADCILTGVGTTAHRQDPQLEMQAEGELVRRATVGNIGGIFLVRPDASASDKRKVEALNEAWTGMRLHHLRACVHRAIEKRRPGVIVIAGGARAEPVAQAVREGLVNRLVIDQELAAQLAKLLA